MAAVLIVTENLRGSLEEAMATRLPADDPQSRDIRQMITSLQRVGVAAAFDESATIRLTLEMRDPTEAENALSTLKERVIPKVEGVLPGAAGGKSPSLADKMRFAVVRSVAEAVLVLSADDIKLLLGRAASSQPREPRPVPIP